MLLTPNAGETEAAFVARFMADEDMIAEYPDEKQRAAVAYKQAGASLAYDPDQARDEDGRWVASGAADDASRAAGEAHAKWMSDFGKKPTGSAEAEPVAKAHDDAAAKHKHAAQKFRVAGNSIGNRVAADKHERQAEYHTREAAATRHLGSLGTKPTAGPQDASNAAARKSMLRKFGKLLAGEAKGIEILRAGEFTGLGGVKVKISDADLDAIAANFADHPDVPMVLGHEEDSPVFKKNIPTDTPAAGWASKVYVAATDKGKRLLADVGSIPDLVGAWVNSKVYRKVSAMLMRGEKGMYLGHIGLLGARAPAVRGLKDFPLVSFADQGNGVLVVREMGGSPEGGVNVDRAAAVKKLQELGADPVLFADSVPDAVVIKLAESLSAKAVEVKTAQDAQQAAEAKLAAGGTEEGDVTEAVKTLNKARDEANAALAALAAANKAGRVARVETVFSAAIKDGRMAPAEAAAMKPAALALADQDAIVVELASGTGTKKVSALEAMLIAVESRPKHVMFAEGAEDPEKAATDSRKDEVVRLAESQYAEVPALRKAYPNKQVFVENQLLAAGIKVEPAKK